MRVNLHFLSGRCVVESRWGHIKQHHRKNDNSRATAILVSFAAHPSRDERAGGGKIRSLRLAFYQDKGCSDPEY